MTYEDDVRVGVAPLGAGRSTAREALRDGAGAGAGTGATRRGAAVAGVYEVRARGGGGRAAGRAPRGRDGSGHAERGPGRTERRRHGIGRP
ncbi:hypothetical protein OG949_07890 [Streptomyces scopuliridis]|uniref:hypothetical protein n=1 Tax=Streptomyces scopuliridis TaxID=452529 RepID=UPI002DD86B1A|nr:hypothetical protein [Streptomyces scopuliridis]WSB32789.1 hypothetical protein OG949_07890 [Streptomyces scopuliridis]